MRLLNNVLANRYEKWSNSLWLQIIHWYSIHCVSSLYIFQVINMKEPLSVKLYDFYNLSDMKIIFQYEKWLTDSSWLSILFIHWWNSVYFTIIKYAAFFTHYPVNQCTKWLTNTLRQSISIHLLAHTAFKICEFYIFFYS